LQKGTLSSGPKGLNAQKSIEGDVHISITSVLEVYLILKKDPDKLPKDLCLVIIFVLNSELKHISKSDPEKNV
jgi:hypothetical protein